MMPALIDNRAVRSGHSQVLSNSNVTVFPRLFAPADEDQFPLPGTPQWGRLNQRRAELIERHISGQLSGAERAELDWLQKETLAAVDRTFPRPPVDFHTLADLERRLEHGSHR